MLLIFRSFRSTSCYGNVLREVAVLQYLAQRRGSVNWYYRESTPGDVRSILVGRAGHAPREVWLSLGTPDRRVAAARLVSARAEQHREWDSIRSSVTPVAALPSSFDLAEAVIDFVHDRFVQVHRRALSQKLSQGLDAASEARLRLGKIAQVELLPSEQDVADMERLAAAVCRKMQWDLAPVEGVRGELWGELVVFVTKAVQHARGTIAQTLDGRPVATSREVVLERIGGGRLKRAKPGEALLDLFALYQTDMERAGKNCDTLATERKVIEQFAGFVGQQRAVAEIGRADIRDFKRVLSQIPHRWVTRPELEGLTLAEAAARWQQIGGDVRSLRTVARELSAVSSLFVWMIENAYVEDNPTRGFFPKIDKAKAKYPPYTQAELSAVFSSPLFASCHEQKEHVAGHHRVRDWRYWLPLCALYSGARAGEIAQLTCTDLRQEEGVWVFDFNEDAGVVTKSLKTSSSRRVVPVHRTLIELGLIDYRNQTCQFGHTQLFPEIKPGPRGDMSYRPSRFWQRYLDRIKVKRRGLALHSFRHSFADECRRKGVNKDVLKALLGHADNSITGHYGTLDVGNLNERRAAIDSLTYWGVHGTE
ncbi:MAG TPA: site-specific integrase [Allosphingosinicella sp.]|nr:site-specific integrase [Allosphingosinicella sp.]